MLEPGQVGLVELDSRPNAVKDSCVNLFWHMVGCGNTLLANESLPQLPSHPISAWELMGFLARIQPGWVEVYPR